MKEKKKLNREWVKTAAIVFLSLMLVLTFFSNTIMNFSLAEVSTSQPESGTLTERVREQATAKANNSYSIETDTARGIVAVYVKEGDEVEEGDKLFELEESSEDALTQAVDALNEARLQYQKDLLNAASTSNASSNNEVKVLQEDLQKAINERNALGTTSTTETAAQQRVDSAKITVDNLQKRYDDLNGELGLLDNKSSLSAYIKTEALAYETALAKVTSIEAQMGGQTLTQFTESITTLENELAGLKQELADLQSGGGTSAQISAKQSAISGVEAQLSTLYSKSASMSTLNSQLISAQAEVDKTKAAVESAAASARSKIISEMSTVQTQLSAAQITLSNAEQALDTVKKITTAEADVTAAQRALTAKLLAIAEEQETESITQAVTNLDLNAKAQEIEKQEAKVRSLESGTGDNGNTITAKYAGIVTGLTAVAGGTAQPNEPLCAIQVADMGYIVEIPVSNENAQKIKIGSSVDVSTNNYYSSVTGTVAKLKPNPEDPSNTKLVEITLTGEVTAGEQMTVGVQLSSASYELIVPKSAVGYDTNGAYVFVLVEKRTALGTRFVAQRKEVTELAKDDTRIAVTGDFSNWDSVITTTNKPITQGDYVRLPE